MQKLTPVVLLSTGWLVRFGKDKKKGKKDKKAKRAAEDAAAAVAAAAAPAEPSDTVDHVILEIERLQCRGVFRFMAALVHSGIVDR